jgi:hypothetical protein
LFFINYFIYIFMEFKIWLEKREGFGSKIMALGIPMASAIGGALVGGATLGPAGVPLGYLGAKFLARNGVEKYLPQSTLELMKKK